MPRILVPTLAIAFGALFVLSSAAAQRTDETIKASRASATFLRCTAKPLESKRFTDCTKVAYGRLAPQDRRVFDGMLDFAGSGRSTADAACTFTSAGGVSAWSCAANGTLCTCVHYSSGPQCACGPTD